MRVIYFTDIMFIYKNVLLSDAMKGMEFLGIESTRAFICTAVYTADEIRVMYHS